MPKITLSSLRSNWEFLSFYLIEPHVAEKHRRFSRPGLVRRVEEIYPLLALIGHKKRPEHLEETLQRTLQNMRDKGWINFIGYYQGEYELTDEGYKVLLGLKARIQDIKKAKEGIRAIRIA